jgi:exodeoxyribonuclease VII large subunit
MRARLQAAAARLDRAGGGVAAHSPEARVRLQRQRLGAVSAALAGTARERVQRERGRLGQAAARLEALSPLAVLGRGYGLVRRARDLGIVRGPDDVQPGERLRVRLAHAELEALVESVRALERS